jgi:hypothetical protein
MFYPYSPKFYTQPSANSNLSVIKNSCGPGSEISFGPSQTSKSNNPQTKSKPDSINNCNNTNTLPKKNTINSVDFEDNTKRTKGNKMSLILSGTLFFGSSITIKPTGYENGLRNKQDGHCYIGFGNVSDRNGLLLIDYIASMKGIDENHLKQNKRLFEIVFDKNQRTFIMNVLHKTLSVNCILTNEDDYYFEYLKHTHLLIGDISLFVFPKKLKEKNILEITVVGHLGESTYSFLEYSMPVTIGRKNCTIVLKQDNVSKVHAFIFFSKEKEKFFIKDNYSTNKTHLILKEGDSIPLEHNYDMKVGESEFKINLNNT